jgi:uncharacterized protein YjdB
MKITLCRFFLCFAALLMALTDKAGARVGYIPHSQTSQSVPSNELMGNSWDNPVTLQEAILFANDSDRVCLGEDLPGSGTKSEYIAGVLAQAPGFQINKSIYLEGGFLGSKTTHSGMPKNWAAGKSENYIPRSIINGHWRKRIFTVVGSGTKVRFTDLTLTGGDASSEESFPHCGGGLYVSKGAEVELKRVAIENSRASSDAEVGKGGGIYVDGKLILKDGRSEAFLDSAFCLWIDKTSNPPMFNDAVDGSSVSKNVASTSTVDGMGGGIYVSKTGEVIVESKGLEITSTGEIVEASKDGDGWYIGYRGELWVEKGVVFSNNTAVAGNKGVGKGGAIYNEGTLHLKRGSSVFENNIAASSLTNTSDAYGGGLYFEKPTQTSGPIYFSGNRAKPVNAAGKSYGHHIWPYQIVTFVHVDTLLKLVVEGEKEYPLSGASYVMTGNTFTFSFQLEGLYEKSFPRVMVNGTLVQKDPSSTATLHYYKINSSEWNQDVDEFKVEIKLVHPVHMSVASVLRKYLTLSPAYDQDGNFIDTIPHGSSFKFTVTENVTIEPPLLASDYFVVVNGRILDKESSRVKRLASNKYEYTITEYATTAYSILIATAGASTSVTFKAPPAGTSYLIDGEPLDFQEREGLIIPYFSGYPVKFIVKHDDKLFEPPIVRYQGVEIRRTYWELADERHFSVNAPEYNNGTNGVISVDEPTLRQGVSFTLTLRPVKEIGAGKTECFSYSVTPSTSYPIPITCVSTDASIVEIVTVNASSKIICMVGKKGGIAKIIGRLSIAGGIMDTVEIEVLEATPPKGSVVYLLRGATKQMEVSLPQAEWRTEDEKIVTVTPEGELYGVSQGEARVIFATGEHVWEIWTVHVLDRENSDKQTVLPENSVYSLQELFGIEQIDQWRSSDPLVAFVEGGTFLHTSRAGKTILSDASAKEDGGGGFNVFVARIDLVKDESLSKPVVGTVGHISDTVRPKEIEDQRIVWTTSHASVAEIVNPDNTGAGVKINNPGETYIQASLKDYPEVKAGAYLSTLSAIEWLSAPPKLLVQNEIVTLSATLNPRVPIDDFLVWDTVPGNNGRIVILSQTGQIQALALGEGKLKVSSKANPAHNQIISIQVVKVGFEVPKAAFAVGDIGSLTLHVLQGRESQIDTLELISLRPDVLAVSKSTHILPGERVFLSALAPGIATLKAQIKGYPNTAVPFSVQVVKLELPIKQIVVARGDAPFSLMPSITPGNLLTWYSTNSQIASVQSHQGIVTPHNVGTTFIVANLYEKEGDATPIVSASCQVTVVEEAYVSGIVIGSDPAMTGLTVVAPDSRYEVGKSYQLAISQGGEVISTSPELTWESGVGENITINPVTGWMVPNVPGPASVKVVYNGIIKTYTFTVVNPSGGIKLNSTELTLYEGETRAIGYSLTPAGNSYGTVRWTSSDKAVSVDHAGLVKANYYGESFIKAFLYHADGSIADSAFCKVKVASESVGFVLSESEYLLESKGHSFTLQVVAVPPGIDVGRAYFVSDNPLVAFINTTGRASATITANNGGSTDIAVYVQGIPGLVKRCKVTVKSTPDNILLNYDELTLPVGKKVSLAAWVFPVTAPQDYTLSSANPAIAQITGSEVTALAVGTTKIIAQTPNGRSTNFTLKVVSPADIKKKLTLSDATLALTRGQKHTILAYSPDNSPVSWKVSGATSAIEFEEGLVRAIAPGEAIVTATDALGNTASCKVTVNIFADRLIVYPYRPRILLVGESFTAKAVLEPVDIPLNEVVWVADNPAVVEIGQKTALTCQLVGMAEGVTLLSAQSADGRIVNRWLLSVQKTRSAIETIEELRTPSVSYHADALSLSNLAGHRVSLTTLSGRTLDGFTVDTDSETRFLSLPAGIYILTAAHQSSRFVTKFVVR